MDSQRIVAISASLAMACLVGVAARASAFDFSAERIARIGERPSWLTSMPVTIDGGSSMHNRSPEPVRLSFAGIKSAPGFYSGARRRISTCP